MYIFTICFLHVVWTVHKYIYYHFWSGQSLYIFCSASTCSCYISRYRSTFFLLSLFLILFRILSSINQLQTDNAFLLEKICRIAIYSWSRLIDSLKLLHSSITLIKRCWCVIFLWFNYKMVKNYNQNYNYQYAHM